MLSDRDGATRSNLGSTLPSRTSIRKRHGRRGPPGVTETAIAGVVAGVGDAGGVEAVSHSMSDLALRWALGLESLSALVWPLASAQALPLDLESA